MSHSSHINPHTGTTMLPPIQLRQKKISTNDSFNIPHFSKRLLLTPLSVWVFSHDLLFVHKHSQQNFTRIISAFPKYDRLPSRHSSLLLVTYYLYYRGTPPKTTHDTITPFNFLHDLLLTSTYPSLNKNLLLVAIQDFPQLCLLFSFLTPNPPSS
jgi:hypothetical protein